VACKNHPGKVCLEDLPKNLTLQIIIYCGDLYFPPLSPFPYVHLLPPLPGPLSRRLAAAATAGGRVLCLHLFFLPLLAPPAACLPRPRPSPVDVLPRRRSTTPHSPPCQPHPWGAASRAPPSPPATTPRPASRPCQSRPCRVPAPLPHRRLAPTAGLAPGKIYCSWSACLFNSILHCCNSSFIQTADSASVLVLCNCQLHTLPSVCC
jgi:hypothetical protein